MLGKRKRPSAQSGRNSSGGSPDEQHPPEEDLRIAFQRHFESTFEPLAHQFRASKDQAARSSSREEIQAENDHDRRSQSPWSGMSSGDEITAVEVVEHRVASKPVKISKAGSRSFMSPKPPLASAGSIKPEKATDPSKADAGQDAEELNSKNDLALQRLINESSLLDKSACAISRGNRRHITNLRLQMLGSKSSLQEQTKMPMSHRRGIVAKAKEREERRRAEAKENGIILERQGGSRPKEPKKRDSGIAFNRVGRFKNGTLSLSRKDVAAVNGRRGGQQGSTKGRIW